MSARQGGFAVRSMSAADLDQVLAIEESSFPRPWTRGHFRHELDSQHSMPLVAVAADGTVAGYLCATLLLDEAEILDVAVRSDLRGRGVGRLLLDHVVELCRINRVNYIHLEVRRSNLSAIGLYERFGFLRTGERRRYYENGDDAILMQLNIGTDGESHAV
jgi:ribosomal-protein-alanine N-acetyltransferase